MKFTNKDGSLTLYSLACGYYSVRESGDFKVELYMEHQHLHVRFIFGCTVISWTTFESNALVKARSLFRLIEKAILRGRAA